MTNEDYIANQRAYDRAIARMHYRSPLEQELIDGLVYWDRISADWMRLIDRRTMDVIGHYKRELGSGMGSDWKATRNTWRGMASESRYMGSAEQAREWIETRARIAFDADKELSK